MAQEEKVGVSVDDYLKADDADVIGGDIAKMTPTGFRHTEVAHALYDALVAYTRPKKHGHVFVALGYVMEGSKKDDWVHGWRVPDVSFISQDRFDAYFEAHDKEGPMWLVPDLAVEIVCPTDSYSAVTQKVAYYLAHGIRLVWVIDPASETVRLHTADDPDGHTLRPVDMLIGDPVLPGWSMGLDALFQKEDSE